MKDKAVWLGIVLLSVKLTLWSGQGSMGWSESTWPGRGCLDTHVGQL